MIINISKSLPDNIDNQVKHKSQIMLFFIIKITKNSIWNSNQLQTIKDNKVCKLFLLKKKVKTLLAWSINGKD